MQLDQHQKDKIRSLLASKLGYSEDSVLDDTNLPDGLGMDSLDKIEIIMQLESEFDININESADDVVAVKTVADLYDVVASRN